jgi:hypothetical protein
VFIVTGSLDKAPGEGAMADESMTVQLRLPQSLIEQADALIEALSRDRDLSAAGRITRATVLRLALARGLENLAQEYR